MKKRMIAGTASLALLLSLLASCGNTPSQPTTVSDTVPEPDTEDQPTEEDDPYAPLRGLDYGQAEISMLLREEFDYEFMSEEENADLVNDAVYARNRA